MKVEVKGFNEDTTKRINDRIMSLDIKYTPEIAAAIIKEITIDEYLRELIKTDTEHFKFPK